MKEQHGLVWGQDGSRDAEPGAEHIERFGNYDLVRPIDTGGMGEVYLARQRTAFGRQVAVKIIRSDLMHDIAARKRFLREAEVSAHLKHEHILPLFEFGEHDGRLFLVTPYIEGGTLARRLQSGPLSLAEVQRLFTALVQAVVYIHKRGVIHRDLKPSNILLDTEDGSDQVYVRLIDFGIASLQGSLVTPPLTEAGHEMGTLLYMAPERANGIAAISNDIYSLGIILYQMLTGQLPTTGKMVTLPEQLAVVIRRCTAGDPENRYASADELLRAFEQAYRSLTAQRPALRSRPLVRPRLVEPTPAAVTPTPQEPRPVEEPAEPPIAEQPTPRRVMAEPSPERVSQPSSSSASRLVWRSPDLPNLPLSGRRFTQEDYNAPTISLNAETFAHARGSGGEQKQRANVAVLTDATPAAPSSLSPATKRKRPWLLLVPVLIVVTLLLLAGMTFYSVQASISAKVTVVPQVRTISRVITVTARPGQLAVDPNSASIPVNTLNDSKTASKSGPTSGRPFLCLVDCPRIVSNDDVDNLGIQLKQGLVDQVTHDLSAQLRAHNYTALGNPSIEDGSSNVDPPVGSQSDTVKVTLTEQGSVSYYNNSDAQSVARTLFEQQAPANYQLLNQFTRVGQPVVKGQDEIGNVRLAVPVAGLEQYQLSPDELQTIQSHIKGMKLPAARSFLARQPGVDARSSVVHVSYGDTLPSSTDQISVLTANPTDFPTVQLPAA